MTLQKIISAKIKEKKGLALIGVLLGAVAFGLLAIPMARWLMQLAQNVGMSERNMDNLGERMEMQSIIQDFWYQINNAPYEELEDNIRTKGKTWTQDVAGKYTMKVSFGDEGKYESATCNTSKTPENADRHCRNALITLTSKSNNLTVESVNTTKVSSPTESELLRNLETGVTDLKGRMTTAENKFDSYYTKNQFDNSFYTKSQLNSTLGNYYTKDESYTKNEVDSKDTTMTTNINHTFTSYDTKSQVDTKIHNAVSSITTKPSSFENGTGVVKFSNGFMIQSGSITGVDLYEQWYNVTFPKKFPNKAISIIVSLSPMSQIQANGFACGLVIPIVKRNSLTQTGATIGSDRRADSSKCGSGLIYPHGTIYWTAFGY